MDFDLLLWGRSSISPVNATTGEYCTSFGMRDRFDDQSIAPFPSFFSCRICHFEILYGDRFGGWDAFVVCRERSDINPLKIFAFSSWQFWQVSSTIITWMMNDRVSHIQRESKKILLSCGIPIKRSDPDLSRPSDRAHESLLLSKFLFSKQGYYQEGWTLWRAEVDVPLPVCFFSLPPSFVLQLTAVIEEKETK
jgi:hypothetical protein